MYAGSEMPTTRNLRTNGVSVNSESVLSLMSFRDHTQKHRDGNTQVKIHTWKQTFLNPYVGNMIAGREINML